MCGIYGCLSFEKGSHPETEIHEALVRKMSRRGPDDEGFWRDDDICTLGFRRLSILDLSRAGSQPMFTPEGRYGIVFNGEMYNFPELKKTLEQEVSYFRSTGDSEVVLYALAKWGIGALERFNGMFALGFYDRSEKRLLLARDHAGIKPLYYMVAPEGLVFASQYDLLLHHPWGRALKPSPEALALYLNLAYIPAPRAIMERTYMLEPGSWIEFRADGKRRSGRFFEFPKHREPELKGKCAYEAIDAAITGSVRRHLLSDVPVAMFLSGGIDSPLVAAKMRILNNGPVKAFTIGTNGDELDESPDAAVYAHELGLQHCVEHARPHHALEMLDDVIRACGEPFADYSIFPTMMVSRLARKEFKVVLSGDGGDELFFGYTDRFGSVLESASAFSQPQWFRSVRWTLKKYLNFGQGHINFKWPNIGEWYRAKHSRLPVSMVPDMFPDLKSAPTDLLLFRYDGCRPDETAQWLRWNEFVGHLTMVLLKVDRASMYHSLEVRVPLLDREVIDVATRIDWTSCVDLKNHLGKIPLRAALKRHISHQTGTKRGFTVPMDAWMRNTLRPAFQEAVADRKEILGFPLNQKLVRKMFRAHLTGEYVFGWGLWTLLSLALWEQRFIKNSSPLSCNSIRK